LTRFDRACRLLLLAGVIGLAALVVFFWMARLGWDLSWDEALNFRAYARNPATAVALYREANNHPLDSLIKSVFYSVFGMHERPGYRISGFLYVAAYVAIGAVAFQRLWRRGSFLTATVLALVMLLPSALVRQAMSMRGYFLAITLEFAYCLLVARDARLFAAPTDPAPAAGPSWTRRSLFTYGILGALIGYTVPINVLAVPALSVLAVLALSPGATAGTIVRRILALGVVSALFTALLYSPILVAIALKLTGPEHFPVRELGGVLGSVQDDIACIAMHLAPRGVPDWTCGAATLAVFGVGALVAIKGSRLARLALVTAGVALLVRIAFIVVLGYPRRSRPSLIVPIAFAFPMIAHAASWQWKPRPQLLCSLVLVAASLSLMPAFASEERPDRRAWGIASFLETYAGSRLPGLLVVHNHIELLDHELRRVLGPEHVVEGRDDLDARLAGRAPSQRFAAGSWKQRLHDLMLGEDPPLPIDPSKVEILAILDHQDLGVPASGWDHPALEALKARLSRHREFWRDFHKIHVYEAQ
jgi:hypothetical protein